MAASFVGTGCAAGEETTAGDGLAFTAASGDRFIVSATPERVVFKKKVGAAEFPFDDKALQGKAILVHPVKGRAEDGVYGRALAVRSDGDDYVVDLKPLTFLEMETVTEDEIVRVYVDPKQSTPNGEPKAVIAPSSFGAGSLDLGSAFQLHPMFTDGLAYPNINVGAAGPMLGTSSYLSPGLFFKTTVEKSSFTPSVLVDWSREKGLELGFRAEMDWKSNTVLNGTVTGEFFRSNAWESPSLWAALPLGIVTVLVRANVRLSISCKATLAGPADLTLDVQAHARVGGSFRVRPSTETNPSEWVSAGSWPGEATGSASIDPTLNFAVRGAIACALPRIELHSKVFGVVGPVVIVSPTAVVDTEGVHAEARVAAGLEAGLFGVGAGIEIPVYSHRF
jgi:hypothetical protein